MTWVSATWVEMRIAITSLRHIRMRSLFNENTCGRIPPFVCKERGHGYCCHLPHTPAFCWYLIPHVYAPSPDLKSGYEIRPPYGTLSCHPPSGIPARRLQWHHPAQGVHLLVCTVYRAGSLSSQYTIILWPWRPSFAPCVFCLRSKRA